MYLKLLILSVILVAFTMLALGVKMLFDKNASFTGHACGLKNEKLDNTGACASCGIKEIANCPETKDVQIKQD